jgi:hypothetical protein
MDWDKNTSPSTPAGYPTLLPEECILRHSIMSSDERQPVLSLSCPPYGGHTSEGSGKEWAAPRWDSLGCSAGSPLIFTLMGHVDSLVGSGAVGGKTRENVRVKLVSLSRHRENEPTKVLIFAIKRRNSTNFILFPHFFAQFESSLYPVCIARPHHLPGLFLSSSSFLDLACLSSTAGSIPIAYPPPTLQSTPLIYTASPSQHTP